MQADLTDEQETKRKSLANKRVNQARKCLSVDDLECLYLIGTHLQTVFAEEYSDEQRGEEDVYFVGINEGRVQLAQEILEILWGRGKKLQHSN